MFRQAIGAGQAEAPMTVNEDGESLIQERVAKRGCALFS